MRKLALFDFDGTLTKDDSLLEFIKFYKGRISFFIGFLLLSPILILYKIKLIPNWKAKEYVLRYFFNGEKKADFDEKARFFSLNIIPRMLRKEAYDKLLWHKNNGYEVTVVSASASNWIKPWTDYMGVELIATRLEVQNGVITGKIFGKNCYGNEKVKRVCEVVSISDFNEVYAYGDSPGDKELLALATHPFYRKF